MNIILRKVCIRWDEFTQRKGKWRATICSPANSTQLSSHIAAHIENKLPGLSKRISPPSSLLPALQNLSIISLIGIPSWLKFWLCITWNINDASSTALCGGQSWIWNRHDSDRDGRQAWIMIIFSCSLFCAEFCKNTLLNGMICVTLYLTAHITWEKHLKYNVSLPVPRKKMAMIAQNGWTSPSQI